MATSHLNKIIALVLAIGVILVCIHFLNQSSDQFKEIGHLFKSVSIREDTPNWSIIHKSYENQSDFNFDFELQKKHFEAARESRLRAMQSASKSNQLANLQMYIVPQVSCSTMIRLGAMGDGGKWVCNPWRIPDRNCIVYSFGVNGDVSFEMDLYRTTGGRCQIYCVDSGWQPPTLFVSFKGIFTQSFICGRTLKTSKCISLRDFMAKFDHKKIDILKMDIESAEFDTLTRFFDTAKIDDRRTNVCQLLVEFHHTNGRLETWYEMFELLEKKGFRMFAKEANMYCPNCYEFSYIHLSCFEEYGLLKGATFATYFV